MSRHSLFILVLFPTYVCLNVLDSPIISLLLCLCCPFHNKVCARSCLIVAMITRVFCPTLMVGVRMPSASNSRHFVMHLCCGFGCKHNNHNNVYQSFQAKFDCAYKYIYNKHNHVYMHVYANVCMIMHICTHITQSYPDVDVHISSSHLNLCLHMN